MKLKKTIILFLTIFGLASAGLFIAGCGEKSDAEKAEDAIKDAGKDAAEAGEGAADAIKGIGK